MLPRGMECVVFSIDGSFAASVSIMGSDPKVRPGAVDVVRSVVTASECMCVKVRVLSMIIPLQSVEMNNSFDVMCSYAGTGRTWVI